MSTDYKKTGWTQNCVETPLFGQYKRSPSEDRGCYKADLPVKCVSPIYYRRWHETCLIHYEFRSYAP